MHDSALEKEAAESDCSLDALPYPPVEHLSKMLMECVHYGRKGVGEDL